MQCRGRQTLNTSKYLSREKEGGKVGREGGRGQGQGE